jgi:hypothetical protein
MDLRPDISEEAAQRAVRFISAPYLNRLKYPRPANLPSIRERHARIYGVRDVSDGHF